MPRRGVAVVSSGGGVRSAAERLAALAGRLTDRDRTLCRLLHQHRVLTTPQLIDLAFPSRNAAEHRLAILHQLGVLDRFRPHHTPGSAPYHYVLGPLGAALLAAEADQEPAELGYRRDRTLALAHSQRLAHLLGVNGFFCALAHAARQHPAAALEVWWSEQRCAARWGRLVHPDGYGRWREHQSRVDFFLEYDRGSEPLGRLAAKLPGYLQLAQASEIATPLLVWLPTPARETTARQALGGSSLPVATATPHPDQTPAGPLWLPLHASGPRRRLAQLATAW
jgi:Replication-relaxation